MADAQVQTPAPQTPVVAVDGPVRSTLDVDALLDRYLPEENTSATPTPEADTETPEAEADTLAGEPEPVEAETDTPEDVAAGEETGDESGLEPTEETPEDDEIDAILAATEEAPPKDTPKESFLPEFDRAKFLNQHPELEAPYKHMQAAFSKKMAEVSRTKAAAELQAEKAEAMEKDLLAFQETLRNDESFEDFLVQVALNRPEVVEKAYERAVSLNEDEGKKKEYLQGRELAETKRQLAERTEREAAAKRQERTTEIVTLTQRVAQKLGLTDPGELSVAERYVANQILQNGASGKERDITTEQLVAAVRRAAQDLGRTKEGAKQSVRAEVRRENLKAAQDRVRQPRRPAAPRSSAPMPAPVSNRVDHRPKQAPLDSWIDSQIGVEP